jgi:hypothetical protein
MRKFADENHGARGQIRSGCHFAPDAPGAGMTPNQGAFQEIKKVQLWWRFWSFCAAFCIGRVMVWPIRLRYHP